MQIEQDVKLDFSDVLIRPKRSDNSSRSDVDLFREYTFLNSKNTFRGVPVVAANMSCIGTFAMSKAMSNEGSLTALHKHYSVDQLSEFFSTDGKYDVFYTMGISDSDFKKIDKVAERAESIPCICIDVANGYMNVFEKKVLEVREKFPQSTIMAGNVCTREMVESLLLSGGADIIKCGIGSGSTCLTRTVTAIGFPQLSSIIECSDAAHGLGGHICSDGGIRQPGDVAKAFGAGADFVMLGGFLAGHDECEGRWNFKEVEGYDGHSDLEKESLEFYGMSSKEAQDKYNGGLRGHRASEGKCVTVPYKGPVAGTLQQITGGLRSTCSYVGAKCLKDLSKKTTFIRVNRTHDNYA